MKKPLRTNRIISDLTAGAKVYGTETPARDAVYSALNSETDIERTWLLTEEGYRSLALIDLGSSKWMGLLISPDKGYLYLYEAEGALNVENGKAVGPTFSFVSQEDANDTSAQLLKWEVEENDVVANPSETATQDLTKIKIDGTAYNLKAGTEVTANPTLAGTESSLTGLEVDGTKYKVSVVVPHASQTDPLALCDISINGTGYSVSSLEFNLNFSHNGTSLYNIYDHQSYGDVVYDVLNRQEVPINSSMLAYIFTKVSGEYVLTITASNIGFVAMLLDVIIASDGINIQHDDGVNEYTTLLSKSKYLFKGSMHSEPPLLLDLDVLYGDGTTNYLSISPSAVNIGYMALHYYDGGSDVTEELFGGSDSLYFNAIVEGTPYD